MVSFKRTFVKRLDTSNDTKMLDTSNDTNLLPLPVI